MTESATMTEPAAAAEPATLELVDVEFRRQRRVILTGVNLTIRRGEHWVLFGPNGIGKSTLVQMMSTRGFPSSGEVHVLGHRLGTVDVFALRRRIGLSSMELAQAFPPQDNPLDAVLGALTATTGRWRDIYSAADYAHARELMNRFGIGYLEGKAMGRLSQGELTRVLMCRAFMADPDVLILDEPTTRLDLGGREIVVRALENIEHGEYRPTVVLVTHRLEEIPAGFDHIAVMGRILGDETRAYTTAVDGHDPAPGTIVYTGDLTGGLTSERLSGIFGLPLEVVRHDGRWNAFARQSSRGTL